MAYDLYTYIALNRNEWVYILKKLSLQMFVYFTW